MKKQNLIILSFVIKSLETILIIAFIIYCIPVKKEVDTINWYYTYNKKNGKFDTTLISFPYGLSNANVVNDYYYHNYKFNRSISVLDVTYDEIVFENELFRLNNLIVRNKLYDSNNDYPEYKKLLYVDDETLFHCPTYIAMYNYDGQYEYVCVNYETKNCVYVYISNLKDDKIPLNDKYMPINYEQNEKEDTNDGYRYTVYAALPDVTFDEWYK